MGRNEAVPPDSQHAGKSNEQHQNLPAVETSPPPLSARRNSAAGPSPAVPQLGLGSSRRLSALPVVAPTQNVDPVGADVALTASSGHRGETDAALSPRVCISPRLSGTQAVRKQSVAAPSPRTQTEGPMRANLQTTAPMPFNGTTQMALGGTQQMPMITPRKSVSRPGSATGSLASARTIRGGGAVGSGSSGSGSGSGSGKVTAARRKGMTMGAMTMAQADVRMATATLRDKRQLGTCKPFADSSFEEQLHHPALAHITLRSRQHRGRKRSKEEVTFLTHSLTKVTSDDPNLHTLKASSEQLAGHWLSGLGRSLPFNTHLRKVMWNNNDVDDGDLEVLCRSMGLGGNQSVLQLTLGNSRLSDVAAYSLSRMLLGNDTLMTLNISGRKPSVFSLTDKTVLPGISALGAGFLSEALDFNSSLTSLVVAQHKMWDAGAAAIARALRVNYTLTHLVLKSNKIGDPGAEALGLALAQNSALTALDLSDNRIGDEGVSGLCEGLQCNKTMRHLDVCGNLIGDGGMQALFVLLASHNPYLIGLGLADNPAGVEAVERVDGLLRRRHTVDHVRHTFNPARTQLDQFKDSNVTMVNTRTYPKDATALPYRYPTAAPLKYPALPSADPDRDEPPVCVVTRENFRIRQRMERAAIGRTKGFKKWKGSALRAKGVVEKREWFPAADTWQTWKGNLMRTYPMGIDHPGQAEVPKSRGRSRGGRARSREEEKRVSVSESPILALRALRGKGPPTVRPPGYMAAEEVRELARKRAKRMSRFFAKSPRDDI